MTKLPVAPIPIPFTEDWTHGPVPPTEPMPMWQFPPPEFLPVQRHKFVPSMRHLRDAYARSRRKMGPLAAHPNFDSQRAIAIAELYDKAPKFDALDASLPAALEAAKRELCDQFQTIVDHNAIQFEWSPNNDAYNGESELLIRDVFETGRMVVFTGGMPHPVWDVPVSPESSITVNHVFRAMHDLWGHCAEGFSFGPAGEWGAYYSHAYTFSPSALRIIAVETRGQSCWTNFGPHMFDELGWLGHPDHPNYLPKRARPYPPQKVFRMPIHFCR